MAGGPVAAAAWAGIDVTWYEEIPTGWQHRLFLWARSEGYQIAPEAFGLTANGGPYYPLPALANRERAARDED